MKTNVIPMTKDAQVEEQSAGTDVGNALRFASENQNVLRYVTARKDWIEFDGVVFQPDELRHVIQRAIKTSDNMLLESAQLLIQAAQTPDNFTKDRLAAKARELQKNARKLKSKKDIESMIAIASTDPRLAALETDLDKDKELFAVQNGVIDLRTGEFRDGRVDDLISMQSQAEYNPKATCSLFISFIEQMQPDPEVRRWIQKLVGYCLSGRTDEQLFIVFHGGGSNGKGVFLSTIKRVLGSYGKNTQFDTFSSKSKDKQVRTDIARMRGSRMVTASEGDKKVKLDEGMVKQLTGEDEVTARFLFGREFDFEPQAKYIVVTNHKPVISGTDNGIWRRMILVPWAVKIEKDKADGTIKDKIAREISGILNWALEGHRMWREEGLKQLPKAIADACREYQTESDVIAQWADDMVEVADPATDHFTSSMAITESFNSWARMMGHSEISQKSLGDRLRERGHENARGKKGERGWKGIKLNPEVNF